MSKWNHLISFGSLMMISLYGDAGSFSQQDNTISDFPLNPQQGWFTKETYLFLKPTLDDIDYANRLDSEGDQSSSTLSMKMKLKKPDFDWFSGVRLGIGRYLPNHDQWDITLYTTYFYASEDDSITTNRADASLIYPIWLPDANQDFAFTEGSAEWRLNYFTWDLSAGRHVSILRTIDIHPFIGLRAALIYKNYNVKYFDNNTTELEILNGNFKSSDNFWGIGPRMGCDLQFKLASGWLLLGNISGSLFYGNYNVKEKGEFDQFLIYDNGSIADTYKVKDHTYSVQANLEGYFGLGWEAWVRNRTVRVAPSIMLEASEWFDLNQLFTISTANHTSTLTYPSNMIRHFGDLGLVGVSFNLQVDF